MDFTSVEQRMARTYLDRLPPFVPDERGPSMEAQRAFYDFLGRLYRLAFDEPERFVPALHEDDAFPNRFNKSLYGKPDLLKFMKKFTGEMDGLLAAMFRMGAGEAVKLSKRQQQVLARLGVEPGAELPEAWVWMCTRPGASLPAFAHCFFKPDHPYISDLFARLLGDEAAFRRLEAWMGERGYRRFWGMNVSASDDDASLSWANPAWSPEQPRGGFEYKIRHTGVSLRYDRYVRQPPVIGLCIPGGMRPYLLAFDRMDARLRRFVLAHTKRCDGCRYCVQTDKTGKRPLAHVTVAGQALCPYFPGCSYCWSRIDGELVDDLTAMLAFMDEFIP